MENKFLEKSYIFDIRDVDFSGKNITLTRNIDLAKYNDYETEAKSVDWKVRCDSEDIEFDNVSFRILKTFYDRFILTATGEGLGRYESILGIKGDKKSLVERRREVFFLWNKQIRYTDRTMRAMLDVLFGSGNYNMTLIYKEYGFILEILVNRNLNLDDLYYMLRKDILPANLDIELRIKIVNTLVLRDKTDVYTCPFYPVGYFHQCGTIFKHQYTGTRVKTEIKLPNKTNVREQRTWITNEPTTGHERGGKK